MADRKKNAPGAGPAAPGAGGDGWRAQVPTPNYHPLELPRNPIVVKASWPDGKQFIVRGQNARTLLVLVEAGERGVTKLEVMHWAHWFAGYCYELRKRHGLDIVTLPESHLGGSHGRYVLRSKIVIVEVITG